MIRVAGVTVRFGDVVALPPVSFEIAEGERVGVVGRNGTGKTTLLRVLAGLLSPTAGAVEGAPGPGRTVLVHQRPHLFTGTALDNVWLGARASRRDPGVAREILRALGLEGVADRDVRRLSGGERRRVAVARALARGPEVLLLDEPLAELDPLAVDLVVRAVAAFRGPVVTTSPMDPCLLAHRRIELGPPARAPVRDGGGMPEPHRRNEAGRGS